MKAPEADRITDISQLEK